MQIFVTGRYGNGQDVAATGYKMRYACFARTGRMTSRDTTFTCGELLGSKPETELQVIQIALKYAYSLWLENEGKDASEKEYSVTIFTDFTNVKKRVNGRIKATSQSAKSLAAFAKTVKASLPIMVVEDIDNDRYEILGYILDNLYTEDNCGKWKRCEIIWTSLSTPTFRVVVRDRNGNVFCDVNERFFGGVPTDAMYFADWYERESKNKESRYYGVTVERYNI